MEFRGSTSDKADDNDCHQEEFAVLSAMHRYLLKQRRMVVIIGIRLVHDYEKANIPGDRLEGTLRTSMFVVSQSFREWEKEV
jgi:rhodanese-related sulfurtransferase